MVIAAVIVQCVLIIGERSHRISSAVEPDAKLKTMAYQARYSCTPLNAIITFHRNLKSDGQGKQHYFNFKGLVGTKDSYVLLYFSPTLFPFIMDQIWKDNNQDATLWKSLFIKKLIS